MPVVTFDALHSQTAHARFLVEDKHAHYIALIKGNQPTLHQWLKALPWREVPLLDKTRATAHGRDEIRRIKAAAVVGIAFPHAVQAVQIVRRRRIATTGKVTLERIYGVTDLTAEQADATEIARRVRGHWGIEKRSTTSGTPRTPRTPPAYAPAPLHVPWHPCATWPSALSDSPTRRTSPLDSGTTPATPTVH